jgi:hypothetical protein
MLAVDTNEFHEVTDPNAYLAWSPVIILRVCYGYTHLDNAYVSNRLALQSNPKLLGMGHYCYVPAGQDAGSCGTFFAKQIFAHGGFPRGHFISWDIEEGTGDQTLRAQQFMGAAHAVLHDNPADEFGYSGEYFWQAHLGTFNQVHRWIAAYGSPEPQMGEVLWQMSSTFAAPGIAGLCDCSTFGGSVGQFLDIINPNNPVISAVIVQHPTVNPNPEDKSVKFVHVNAQQHVLSDAVFERLDINSASASATAVALYGQPVPADQAFVNGFKVVAAV